MNAIMHLDCLWPGFDARYPGHVFRLNYILAIISKIKKAPVPRAFCLAGYPRALRGGRR